MSSTLSTSSTTTIPTSSQSASLRSLLMICSSPWALYLVNTKLVLTLQTGLILDFRLLSQEHTEALLCYGRHPWIHMSPSVRLQQHHSSQLYFIHRAFFRQFMLLCTYQQRVKTVTLLMNLQSSIWLLKSLVPVILRLFFIYEEISMQVLAIPREVNFSSTSALLMVFLRFPYHLPPITILLEMD